MKNDKNKTEKFGATAKDILDAASRSPQNPWAYFGRSLRRSWAYAYFTRLHNAGLLQRVPAPEGRQGYHWYIRSFQIKAPPQPPAPTCAAPPLPYRSL